MRCDTCGKFRDLARLRRRAVTQADYLFGDPGPFYDCEWCLSSGTSTKKTQ